MTRTRFATGALERMKGLLFSDPAPGLDQELLVLAPCASIHTVGMRHPIDIAFVSNKGLVLKSCRRVLPGRLEKCPDASLTIERFTPDSPLPWDEEPWFEQGDVVDVGYQLACRDD